MVKTIVRNLFAASFGLFLICSPALGKTEIKVWGIYNPKDVGFDKAIAEYERSHPGVRVNYTSIDWGTDKFLSACVGGVCPDVVIAADEWIRLYIDHKLLSQAPRSIEDDLKKNFYPGVQNMAARQGKVYGLPVEFQFYALAYNKTLFQERGLPAQAPSTWEEVSLAGKKLAVWDGNKISRTGFNAWANGGSGELSTTLLALWASNGAENLPDDLKNFSLLTKERREALEFFVSQIQNKADGVNPKLNPWTDFSAGRLPMWINGIWVTNQKQIKNPAVWKAIDVAPIPKGRGRSSTLAWSWLACVPSGSRHKAEAWDFVKVLTNESNGRTFADLWSTAVPRMGGSNQWKDHLHPKFTGIAATVATRAIYNKAWPQISVLMGNYAFQAITGKLSVDEALTKMEREMKALQK